MWEIAVGGFSGGISCALGPWPVVTPGLWPSPMTTNLPVWARPQTCPRATVQPRRGHAASNYETNPIPHFSEHAGPVLRSELGFPPSAEAGHRQALLHLFRLLCMGTAMTLPHICSLVDPTDAAAQPGRTLQHEEWAWECTGGLAVSPSPHAWGPAFQHWHLGHPREDGASGAQLDMGPVYSLSPGPHLYPHLLCPCWL